MSPPSPRGSERFPVCTTCPICRGAMELVYDKHHQQVCVCVDCHSGLTVPATAIEVARQKREGTWKPQQ